MTTVPDNCHRCGASLRIVRVKFSLTGARLITLCPDCALTKADGPLDVKGDPAAQHALQPSSTHPLLF